MSAPAVALAHVARRREPEQLLLRPVLFNRLVVREPPEARAARRLPPGAKQVDQQGAAPPARPWRHPLRVRTPVEGGGDLLAYRAPVRRAPRRAPPARPKRVPLRQAPKPAKLAPIRPAALRVVPQRKQRPGARPRSLGLKPLTKLEKRQLRRDEAWLRAHEVLQYRPVELGDCAAEPGPCPWVSCTAHLYLDVDDVTGVIKLNFPDKQVWELAETCAHRVVAKRGALSLEE